MRKLASLAFGLVACAEYRSQPPIFPEGAAGQPVVFEQALLGLSPEGDALAAQLVDADGAAPQLGLIVLDHEGGPTRQIAAAGAEQARAVARRVREAGDQPLPLLAAAVLAEWPQAAEGFQGFAPQAPAAPEPGRRRWSVSGATEAGALPLALRASEVDGPQRALVLLLVERPGGLPGGDEAELARMPLSGASVAPELWLSGGTAWLLCGSVGAQRPLHRAVGLRRGSLRRGEAELHNAHGLADYGAGELDAASREFDRAIAADPGFVDGLYNAAAAAALSDHTSAAVDFLRRAAAADPKRVQVLGRDDDDLRLLRRRPDVREILGLRRLPPEDSAAPGGGAAEQTGR